MKGISSLFLWLAVVLVPGHAFGQWPKKNTSRLIKIELNDKGALIGTLPPTLNPSDRLQFFIHAADTGDRRHFTLFRQAMELYNSQWSNSPYKNGYEWLFTDTAQSRKAMIEEIRKTNAYLNHPDDTHLDSLQSNKLLPIPDKQFNLPATRITINFPGREPVSVSLKSVAGGAVSEKELLISDYGDLTTGQTITFRVEREDKYQALVIDHFKKAKRYLNREQEKQWNQLLKEIISYAPLIDTVANLSRDYLKKEIDRDAYINGIQQKCRQIMTVSALLDQLQTLNANRWLSTWLWYTRGTLRFNPFDFSGGQPLKDYTALHFKPDTSGYYHSFTTTVDSAIARLRKNPRPGNPDTILLLADKQKQGAAKLIDKSAGTTFVNDNNKAAEAFQQTTSLTYKGSLLVSTEDQLKFVRYHDALKGYTLFPKTPKDYPEDYAMYVGMLNVPTDKIVTLDQRLSDFTEKAEFTNQVQEALGAISGGKSAVTEAAKIFESIKTLKSGTQNIDDNCVQTAGEIYEHYLFVTLGYPGDLPVPDKLSNKTDSSNYKYSSILAAQDDKAAPFTNEYSIVERLAADTSKKQTAKGFRYNVGKLRSFAIGAGLAFGFSQVTQVNADSVGALSTATDAARAKFIVGLKYYPFKTFLRDNGICPRWPERRFSLFGGFEVLDPLNNLYLGIGYDIVPGLNVNVGANFYRQHYYRVQNDRILDKATRMPAVGYLAITLDPEVVVDLIKLMAK
ncbi:hypothetical protein HHL17_22385 [Chitinophaga sp. G-6-1-13]|uniref:Uncharacterized protein n=1 Tax=Chitinophaga fulva TaxID=2728842 RepID=A0A848GNC2_9BACT|nr:hypothetical protein [Chitinophaga fulva]NML39966.1 hypothetical protein [Chitinophaga fulva]